MFAMHKVPQSQLVLAIKPGPVEYTSQRDGGSPPYTPPLPTGCCSKCYPTKSIILSKKIIKQMDCD